MRKIITLVLVLFLISSVSAYVKPIEYKGVKLKFYDDKIDKDNAKAKLNDIDRKYLKGVNHISYFTHTRFCQGNAALYYWFTSNINVCVPSTQDLIHELAHHRQKVMGDSYYESRTHTGRFQEFYSEINGEKIEPVKITPVRQKIEEKKEKPRKVEEKKYSAFINFLRRLFRI